MISSVFSAVVAVAISSHSLAQSVRVDSVKNKEIKEITVLGGMSKTFALPLVVVDASAFETSSFNTPADALQRETGISLVRDGVWATSINIRGLSEQRLLFLVDGDRIQTATDIAGALSTIDMNSMNQIEVIKGASSVLYGTGAMGGVVNFVPQRPSYSTNPETKGKIGTEYHTANALWANTANIQFVTNQWYLTLNGSFRTAQNMTTPDGKIPNSQYNDASWGLRAGIKYAPNEEFLVNYQHVEAWNVGLPGGIAFPANATVRYKEVSRNQLSGEYIISDISRTLSELRLKVYSQDISRDVENKANPTTVIVPGSFNRTSGAKITSEWDFNYYNTLILGLESWVRDSETSRMRFVTTSDTTYNVFGEQPTPNARMLDVGLFAHHSWKIIPQKLVLNTGVRVDYIHTANDSAFNPLFKYTVENKVRTNDDNLVRNVLFESAKNNEFAYAAHVDVTFNPSRYHQFALSVSNSYRAASIEERFKYIEQGAILRVGNPLLRPEKGTFSNFNYTLSTNSLRLKLDAFANYLTNLITEKQGMYVSPGNAPRQAFVNENVNKALFVGAEADVLWLLSNQFWFIANASYTRARNLETNEFLPQIPPLHGFFSFNYKLKKRFEASLSSLWTATQLEAATNEPKTQGHIIYNFDIHTEKIKLSKSFLQFFAGVDNILNTAYLNHLSTTRGIIRLEPGRNIFVKAKWGW